MEPNPDPKGRVMSSLNTFTRIALVLLTLVFAAGCATVPMTGRKQLSLVSDAEMNALSYQQYDQVIAESTLSSDAEATAMVKRVGANIQKAVEDYFAREGASSHLAGYEWEFNLIESDQVNAWCMPGGKVAFYTGILPICQDEDGVAVVMGHEIAHAIAEHGGERMSHQLAVQMGGIALSEAVKSQPEQTRALYMGAFAVGSHYGAMLPYSRKHESEADHMGLNMMAMAGYDPRKAPAFWERMSAGGGAPPEFMSTHPSDETRIRQLNEHMPEAMEYYRASQR
jgi:predicted Zn-dependent protease